MFLLYDQCWLTRTVIMRDCKFVCVYVLISHLFSKHSKIMFYTICKLHQSAIERASWCRWYSPAPWTPPVNSGHTYINPSSLMGLSVFKVQVEKMFTISTCGLKPPHSKPRAVRVLCAWTHISVHVRLRSKRIIAERKPQQNTILSMLMSVLLM